MGLNDTSGVLECEIQTEKKLVLLLFVESVLLCFFKLRPQTAEA